MERAPRVSVLMPVHNGAAFLEATLESIHAQTFTEFELVAVDDGSTDDTARILARHQTADARLVVVPQENAGISAALNAGLARCRGELVARIDADDIMVPERLATQVAFLDRHPELGFCGSTVELIDARGRQFGTHDSGVHELAQLRELIAQRRDFSYIHPAVMYRRADVLAVGGYRAAYEPCEDLDLFLRLIGAGRPGVDLAEPLVRYRQHDRSVSAGHALTQVRMRRLLFHNFYAAEGSRPTQDYATFYETGAGSTLRARWRDSADALGAVAGYRIAGGRPLTGWVLGGVAVLLKAPRLLRRRAPQTVSSAAPEFIERRPAVALPGRAEPPR